MISIEGGIKMFQTEMRNPDTIHIDKASSLEITQLMNAENRKVNDAIDAAAESIAKAIDMAADAIANGGRLVYIGAGTSGRLGIMDAAECPPTFGVDYNTVVGVIAGGYDTLVKASEGAEDNAEAAVKDLKAINLTGKDVVVGISASGNADYVISALEYIKSLGGGAVSLCCNPEGKINDVAHIAIVTETGPEAITGSTRLKAGTAHKLVLNMLSTGAMIKTGKVYENYMINVRPVNKKLRDRCIRIVRDITGATYEASELALDKADGSIKNAIELLK